MNICVRDDHVLLQNICVRDDHVYVLLTVTEYLLHDILLQNIVSEMIMYMFC